MKAQELYPGLTVVLNGNTVKLLKVETDVKSKLTKLTHDGSYRSGVYYIGRNMKVEVVENEET
jgi:hypothetical protein